MQQLIIGSGMSGMKVVDEVLKINPLAYQITIIGEENVLPYNRIMLSPVLAGEKTFEDIQTHNQRYFQQNNIIFKSGCLVVKINKDSKQVILTGDEVLQYDKLVICTGSRPLILPLVGRELKGVVSFRDIFDVEYMQTGALKIKSAAVIGTGLLGLEVANGLNELGIKTTVIGNMDSIMDRQLDQSSGGLLQKILENKNINFKLGAITTEIIGENVWKN